MMQDATILLLDNTCKNVDFLVKENIYVDIKMNCRKITQMPKKATPNIQNKNRGN